MSVGEQPWSAVIERVSISWSCVFCRKETCIEFPKYEDLVQYTKTAWENAMQSDIDEHMYVEVKEYMMSKNQYPTEEKAYYVLSQDPENILKYVDNYQEFKDFCFKKRMAHTLMELSQEQFL